MTQNVVARSEALRNGDNPGVVVGNQLVTGPLTRCHGAVDQTTLVDLEELKRGLVSVLAFAGAFSEVIKNGSVMALRPRSPLKLNSSSGGDLS